MTVFWSLGPGELRWGALPTCPFWAPVQWSHRLQSGESLFCLSTFLSVVCSLLKLVVFLSCCSGESEHSGGDSGPGKHQPRGEQGGLHSPLCHLRVTARCQVYRTYTHICGYCGKGQSILWDYNHYKHRLWQVVFLCRSTEWSSDCCRFRPWNAACCPSHLRLCPWGRWDITTTRAYWWMKKRLLSYRRTLGLTER